jgi:hypothetical protein
MNDMSYPDLRGFGERGASGKVFQKGVADVLQVLDADFAAVKAIGG